MDKSQFRRRDSQGAGRQASRQTDHRDIQKKEGEVGWVDMSGRIGPALGSKVYYGLHQWEEAGRQDRQAGRQRDRQTSKQKRERQNG